MQNPNPEPAPTPPRIRWIFGLRTSFVIRHSSFVLLLCSALLAHAQPTAFTYQGFLTVNGAPANSTNDFEFRLFNAATSGAQQEATITLGDVGVTNGLFTVSLDFGGAVFTGADRWLDIAVRPGASAGAYTNLLPRQPITATPYAVHAGGATAAGITGALPSTALAGTYSGMVSFNNAANVFAGNGAGLTNLNATSLGGVAASNYWRIGGNAGVTTNRYIGTTDYQPMELRVNDSPALRMQPAPQNWPNLVGGAANNAVFPDNTGVAIGGGVGNSVYGTSGGAHIGGGHGNILRTNSAGAYIGGGTGNLLGDGSVRSVIGGGWSNWIGGATGNDPRNIARDITDGTSNTILVGETFPGNAFIGGGWANRIGLDCPNGVITGGRFNSIADGTSNTILFSETERGGGFIGGGRGNIIQTNSPCDVIVGGGANFLLGDGSVRFIGGGVDNVTDGCSHTFLGGGGQNRIGGSGDYAFLGGGWRNTNQTQFGVIVGGLNNRIGGEAIGDFFAGGGAKFSGSPGSQWGDAIVGGSSNIIFGDGSVRFIASGINNVIDGTSNTILVGGGENRIQSPADYAFLGGGWRNTNLGIYSVVGGGTSNLASGSFSTVPGGTRNTAAGEASLAAGQGAQANHDGTFAWADVQPDLFASTGSNQFLIRASGGVAIGTNDPAGAMLRVASGATNTASPTGHVVHIQDTESGSTSGLAIQSAYSFTPEDGFHNAAFDNFITFFDADGASLGSIEGNGSGGVQLGGPGSDFAEYLPKANPAADISARHIVGVSAGRVVAPGGEAEQFMVVTAQAIVAGNRPGEGAEALSGSSLVSFIGQVPVQVRGRVNSGDFILASETADGTGIALPAEKIHPSQMRRVVGRAWESSDETGLKPVNTAVGLDQTSLVVPALERLEQAGRELRAENAALKTELANLKRMIEALANNGGQQ